MRTLEDEFKAAGCALFSTGKRGEEKSPLSNAISSRNEAGTEAVVAALWHRRQNFAFLAADNACWSAS